MQEQLLTATEHPGAGMLATGDPVRLLQMPYLHLATQSPTPVLPPFSSPSYGWEARTLPQRFAENKALEATPRDSTVPRTCAAPGSLPGCVSSQPQPRAGPGTPHAAPNAARELGRTQCLHGHRDHHPHQAPSEKSSWRASFLLKN